MTEHDAMSAQIERCKRCKGRGWYGDLATAPPCDKCGGRGWVSPIPPERYPTVGDLRRMLEEFPDDMPVAVFNDELGTYWPPIVEKRRLRWQFKRVEHAWVDALGGTEDDNGTETDHVCL